MTVIVWDGHTLAADKRCCSSSLHYAVTKIKRINGHLVGSGGDFSPINAMFRWFENGANPDALPDCQKDKDRWASLLVITPYKKILRYEQDGIPFEIEETRAAVGSGRDYALGAMAMGASAALAVEIACRFDPSCGEGIDQLELT